MAKKFNKLEHLTRINKKNIKRTQAGVKELSKALRNNNISIPGDNAIDVLQVALDKFAFANFEGRLLDDPDYVGFKNWYAHINRQSQFGGLIYNKMHPNNTVDSTLAAKLPIVIRERSTQLSVEIEAIQMDPSLKATENKTALLKINQLKLIISIYFDNERATNNFEAIGKYLKSGITPDEDLEELTQAELRIRLFSAFQSSNWPIAFLTLGKLQKKSHDPGEIAYLQALAHYYSQEYLECIRWAKKLTIDQADYPYATALCVESHALLSQIDEAMEVVKQTGISRFSPMFLRYIFVLAISNSKQPFEVVRAFESVFSTESGIVNIKNEDDPFFPAFTRLFCEIAVRYVEYFQAIALDEELESSTINNNDDSTSNISSEDPADIPTELARLLIPLSIDPTLLNEINSNSDDRPFLPILKRLLNGQYKPQPADFIQGYKTLLRLRGGVFLLNSVAEMLGNVEFLNSHIQEVMEIVQATYIEASLCEHPLTPKFLKFLEATKNYSNTEEKIIEDLNKRRMLSQLCIMSRQSYEWAERALITADADESRKIRDTGLISLGYIRILELELNQKLLLPHLKNASVINKLERAFKDLKQRCANDITKLSKNKQKDAANSIQIWDRLVPSIVDVLNGRNSGLLLASLDVLIGKTQKFNGIDADFKTLVAEIIRVKMTPTGVHAHESGELGKLIAEDIREKFRNPPAHTRFMPIEQTLKCKAHVDLALNNFSNWFQA